MLVFLFFFFFTCQCLFVVSVLCWVLFFPFLSVCHVRQCLFATIFLLLLLGGSLCKIVANSNFFSTTNGKSHKTSAIQVFKYISWCTHIHRCCCYDDDDDVMGTLHRCLSLLSLKVVGPGDFFFFWASVMNSSSSFL